MTSPENRLFIIRIFCLLPGNYQCVKQGYLFAEVPYRLFAGHPGVSKAVTFPSFLQVARGYLRLVRDTYILRRSKQVARPWAEESQTARRRNVIGP